MFQDTRPAALDGAGGEDPYAEFRVGHPQERVALLRQLRDGQQPVILNGPDGSAFTTTLWSIDEHAGRMHFAVGAGDPPALQALLDGDEAIAVAYMDSVKLQFELQLHAVHVGHGDGLVAIEQGLQRRRVACAHGKVHAAGVFVDRPQRGREGAAVGAVEDDRLLAVAQLAQQRHAFLRVADAELGVRILAAGTIQRGGAGVLEHGGVLPEAD